MANRRITGEALALARGTHNASQDEVARALSTPRGTYAGWELTGVPHRRESAVEALLGSPRIAWAIARAGGSESRSWQELVRAESAKFVEDESDLEQAAALSNRRRFELENAELIHRRLNAELDGVPDEPNEARVIDLSAIPDDVLLGELARRMRSRRQ